MCMKVVFSGKTIRKLLEKNRESCEKFQLEGKICNKKEAFLDLYTFPMDSLVSAEEITG